MNNGDDINNLLKTLGHDAGLYQDLAKYNASRAALRRAAMVRPVEPVATPPQAPALAPATPPVLRVVQTSPPAGSSSLSSILNRLASPQEPAPADGRGPGAMASLQHAPGHPSPQPTRLDRLFGRLATRSSGSPDR
ncbi:hypothetical protein [Sphaerotilus sp.]|uniref:hypothetical protein n=1 Tax=Sphaerotilus sp. TaxID=2093942 RepID=UPI0034E22E76